MLNKTTPTMKSLRREGRANVFVAVQHANSEVVGRRGRDRGAFVGQRLKTRPAKPREAGVGMETRMWFPVFTLAVPMAVLVEIGWSARA
jgi:hypothetical protein